MNRRDFSSRLLAAGLLPAALRAHAQVAPVEGKDFIKLSQQVPVPPGKIEVIEFFWYGCPHCMAFEPTLDAWQKKLPADVAFRRVPVAFRDPYLPHSRIFYALEILGKLELMHRKVFPAAQPSGQLGLLAPDDIAAFMGRNGIEPAKFLEVYNSFSVNTKIQQARQLAAAYKIDGVPTLGIQGRYYTSPALAGGADRAVMVADALIARARKGG